MFFSVIVPVYRVEEYLPACIESVLHQSFSDWELILVDDGSPDGCGEICDRYSRQDSRIRVIHKANGGLASARRAGIPVAAGTYVLNLDSDDRIENDTLERAYQIIQDTDCDILSFSYRWMKGDCKVGFTNDGLEEGLYAEEAIARHIYPRLLMDRNMNHVSYYLSGKVIRRTLLTPIQLGVSESLSLGEDLCCVVPCYLQAKRVYLSKKEAYLYTVRETSISKAFNTEQILLVENILAEIRRHDASKIPDFQQQLCRYSWFMCFAILAAAAEGNHRQSLARIRENILRSVHAENIRRCEFGQISPKSRVTLFLMKKDRYREAFFFLKLCKHIRTVLKRG